MLDRRLGALGLGWPALAVGGGRIGPATADALRARVRVDVGRPVPRRGLCRGCGRFWARGDPCAATRAAQTATCGHRMRALGRRYRGAGLRARRSRGAPRVWPIHWPRPVAAVTSPAFHGAHFARLYGGERPRVRAAWPSASDRADPRPPPRRVRATPHLPIEYTTCAGACVATTWPGFQAPGRGAEGASDGQGRSAPTPRESRSARSRARDGTLGEDLCTRCSSSRAGSARPSAPCRAGAPVGASGEGGKSCRRGSRLGSSSGCPRTRIRAAPRLWDADRQSRAGSEGPVPDSSLTDVGLCGTSHGTAASSRGSVRNDPTAN